MKFNINGQEVELKMPEGGSGASIVVAPMVKRNGDAYHTYIGVSESFDMSQDNVSLLFLKKKRVRTKINMTINPDQPVYKHNGWHSIPKVPIVGGVREPLFTPVLLSKTPAFTERGIAYYEWSMMDGICFSVWAEEEGTEKTGYKNKDDDQIDIRNFVVGRFGIAVMKDGAIVSPVVSFRALIDEDDLVRVWC